MHLPLPQNIEGNEPPLTEEVGCPSFISSSVRPQTHRSFANQVLDSRTNQSVKQHYSETIEEIPCTWYAFTRSNTKINDRELYVETFGTSIFYIMYGIIKALKKKKRFLAYVRTVLTMC